MQTKTTRKDRQERRSRASAQSLGHIKSRNLYRQLLGYSVGALAIFTLAFMLVPTLISEASATDALAGVRWGAVSLTLDPDVAATEEYETSSGASGSQIGDTGHGDINFGEMVPSTKTSTNFGTLKVLKKTIGITSTGSYYTVYLSTNGTTNSLNYSGSETSANIPAITSDGTNSGDWDTPAQLKGNGWGFAVPGTPIETSSSTSVSPVYPSFGLTKAEFSASSITNLLDTQIIKEDGNTEAKNTLYDNSRWSAVPVKSSPQQIWKAEANSVNGFGIYENGNGVTVTGDTTNNTFDVYYAVMVNTNTLAGTYQNQIVYTALASATAIDQVSNNIVISTNIGGQGEPETVWFELSDSASAITEDDITIALVPHKELVAANYMELNDQPFSLDKLGHDINYYASTYGTCAITAGSLVINDGSDDSISHLNCTMPNMKDFGVNTEQYPIYPNLGENVAFDKGNFDLWLQIGRYDYDYITKTEYEANTYIPAFVYAGLQSTYSSLSVEVDLGDGSTQTVAIDPRRTEPTAPDVTTYYNRGKIIKTMQEITPRICALTRPWNNKTGEEAKVLEPTVSGVRTTTANAYDANIGMGTFALEDERDGKTYLVRRLADGNCWMVQNLDLDLEAVANGEITLDSTNTDLNSKTSWGPDPTTITSSFSGATTARTYDNGWDYIAYDSSTDTYSVATDSAYSTSHGSQYIGDYYNFYAATAETGIDESRIASESICPKGWTLPLGYKNNSAPAFAKLLENYGIATAMSSTTGVAKLHSIPLSFEFSGYYDNNTSFLNNINRALYLSSQEYTEDQSYFRALDFYRGSGNIYVPGVTTKSTGGAIRCVARD